MTNPAGTPLIELLEREANSLDSWVAKHAGEPDTGKFVELSSSVSILLHSASAELAAAIAERDEAKADALQQFRNCVTERGLRESAERTAEQLRSELASARALLTRYRNETPLGHQPHMIAHEVDELLAAAISEAGEGK